MNCPCPNNSYELFYDDFKEIFDSCFPNKTIKINTKYNRSPHITPALKKCIREKHRLEKLAYKWPLTFREQYRTYRNKLASLLKEAKRTYHQNQLVANQGDPKSHWNSINNILGKSATYKKSKIELKPFCSNIPDIFNEHFLKAGGQTIENIGNYFKNYLLNSPNFSMYMYPTTNTEIIKYIKSLKTSSCGHDDIPPVVLKKCSWWNSGSANTHSEPNIKNWHISWCTKKSQSNTII